VVGCFELAPLTFVTLMSKSSLELYGLAAFACRHAAKLGAQLRDLEKAQGVTVVTDIFGLWC
jgi:hypothetical protein